MSDDSTDLWYQLGYVTERLRLVPGDALDRGTNAASRLSERLGGGGDRARRSGDASSGGEGRDLLRRLGAAGATSLALRLLRSGSKGGPGIAGLALSGAAGAGAAVFTELVAPLLSRRVRPAAGRRELGDALFTGVGRGLLYGSVVRDRVPGPAFLAGFLFGTAEYVAAERGGLARILRAASPHRHVPFVSDLFEADPDDDPDWREHVIFGIALALLYEPVRPKSGTTDDE